MLPDNPHGPKSKVSLNAKTGLLEVYDVDTGKLLAIQESKDDIIARAREDLMVERLLPDGTLVRVERSIDPARLVDFQYKEYSSYVVDLICEKVAAGGSITKICRMPGFPSYAELCRWKRLDPSVQERLDEARRDRAEALRDELYDEGMNVDSDNFDATKVKVDVLKYLAGSDDKQRYGGAKTSGAVEVAPVQIMINTGIVREKKDG